MRSIRLAFLLALAAAAPVAGARGWQGVDPGASTAADVTARFGPPTTQGKLGGRGALVYRGEQAIPGTRQAQFFTREDGLVTEVVVFPASQLDREGVEGTYGRPSRKSFTTDDFRPVWAYEASGLTVFFDKEGLVAAISFKAAAGPATRGARAPAADGGAAAPVPAGGAAAEAR